MMLKIVISNQTFLILSFNKKDKKNRNIITTLQLHMMANNEESFKDKIDDLMKDFKDIKFI